MENIFTYLRWRGDLSFTQSPFCEVDALVLARLSYIPFEGFVEGDFAHTTPLGEMAADFLRQPDADKRVLMQNDITLLRMIAENRRFRDVRLCGYRNLRDAGQEMQFSAVTFVLPTGETVVAYRGTDDTIVGWKENFNMAFASPVPAQLKAADYVNRAGETTHKPLIVCGHSKGGNLAVYGASFCRPEVQDRITAVYSYDGPGLTPEQAASPEHTRLMPRIQVMIPRGSFVGTLFEQTDDVIYVESDAVGLMQHYSYNWQVEGMGFVLAKKPTDPSAFMTGAMRDLIHSMSIEERRMFVEALYSILAASEATNLVTLFDEWQVRSLKMLRYYRNLDKPTRDLLIQITRKFLKAAAAQARFPLPEAKQ